MNSISKFISIIVAIFFFAACLSESVIEEPLRPTEPSIEVYSFSRNTIEEFTVSQNLLSEYIRLFHKGKVVESIYPVEDNGVILAYNVSFANEEGWALISADTRVEPLLAFSEEGVFSFSDKNIAVETIFELLRQANKNGLTNGGKINSIWDFLTGHYLNAVRGDSAVRAKTKAPRAFMTGMWRPMDTTIRYVTQASPKLTSTQWHQHFPWNRYTPKINGNNCLVGCGPVAVGQLIYKYFASNPGTNTIPSSMTYYYNDWITSFSNYTTTAWSYLVEAEQPTVNDNDTTALFLSWIGSPINMDAEYGLTGSPTGWNDHEHILNNYFNYRNGFNVGDNNTAQKNKFCDTLKSSIFSGSPVLFASKDHNGYTAHTFLIDKCTISETQYVIRYVFDPYYNVTEEEYYLYPSWMFQWPGPYYDYDPEVDIAETEESSTLSSSLTIQMNWGFPRGNNNINYNNINYLLRSRFYSNYNGVPSMSEYIYLTWTFGNDIIGDVYHWGHHFSRIN